MIRQQGYMLAQIVAEIHAPDRAVGEVSGEGEAVIVEGVGLSGYRAEEDAVFSAAGVYSRPISLAHVCMSLRCF